MNSLRPSMIAVAVLLLLGSGVALAGFDVTLDVEGDELTFANVIGEITVEGHNGNAYEIVVHVRGEDATRDRVRVVQDDGRRARVAVEFPLDESRDYVYPGMRANKTEFTFDEGGRGWIARMLGGDRIEVRQSGRGLEIWADATIRVPRGAALKVRHGAGRINAANVRGDVDLDSHSGRIEISGVSGDVRADTGSGRVSIERCDSKRIVVDTGSGRVDVTGVEVGSLEIDTGSGRVEARDVAADDALIDTGSGSVLLELTRMGDGRFEIDTGSGSVELALPGDASADISAGTGSGGIRIDLDQAHDVERGRRGEARLRGGGGAARVVIDTGSGGVRIVEAD